MNCRSKFFLLNVFVIVTLTYMSAIAEKPQNQEISWQYQDQGFTSSVHKKHAKKIVWSKSEVSFRNQESNVLESRFNLTDPIFGRVYLEKSIRNTPVYSSVSSEPLENHRNSFEWKLYIDDKDAGGSFGVFYEGYYNDDMGKTWTTWQFSPHLLKPENADEKKIVSAWEKAVRGLAAGEHDIRFELWGVQGQQRSAEPMAVGSFVLVVSKGERIGTVSKFPKATYSGNDALQLGNQLKNALVQKGIAQSSEIKKLAITSDWAYNQYTDTKKEYRKISATVLFTDKDNDGICRFVTYNFISDKTGNGWSIPRFHSFCNGCPEGDINCAN